MSIQVVFSFKDHHCYFPGIAFLPSPSKVLRCFLIREAPLASQSLCCTPWHAPPSQDLRLIQNGFLWREHVRDPRVLLREPVLSYIWHDLRGIIRSALRPHSRVREHWAGSLSHTGSPFSPPTSASHGREAKQIFFFLFLILILILLVFLTCWRWRERGDGGLE